MKPTYPIAALTLFVIVGLSAACGGVSITLGDDIDATGDLVTQTFDLDGFDSVEVNNAFEAFITVGETHSVEVLVNEDLLEELDIRVRNGTLKVGLKNGISVRNGTFEATIELPRLDTLEATGATSTEVVGIVGPRQTFLVGGASSLVAEGSATTVIVEANGASSINLRLDDVVETQIDLNGASSLDLLATDRVVGKMNGASNLTLPNEAALDVTTSGASDITGR